MKKMVTMVSFLISMPGIAQGIEFQTPGAMGMGGAGVARNNGSLTSYWNPAAGAFSKSSFALNAGVGVGIKGSDGLAENVDRFSNIDFDNVKNFDTASATADNVGDFVKTLSILDDIDARKGNIAVAVIAPVSFSSGSFSFGIFGNMEGYVQPITDTGNIFPNTTSGTATLTVKNLYQAVQRTPGSSQASGYFSADQLATLTSAITAADPSVNATDLANAIDNQLNDSGIDPNTALSTMTGILPTLGTGTNNTLKENTTSVMTKAVQYVEIPLSYGYPINVGSNSELGIGVTGKLISGTVYQNQVLLVNRQNGNVTAKDLIDDITTNKKSSLAYGIDLGALYKYKNWLSVGLVGKNLNSPKLDAPDYYNPKYNSLTKKVELTERASGGSITLKPQVRSGVAIDPVSWMTFAADLDLTENDTVAPVGSSITSRNFGGGVEFKPASWLKLRGGAYKNLAGSNGNVLTAGFKFFLLDVDGAFATDTFTIDGNELPKEVKVNAAMSFSF
ncbi:MAG: conjugal transfer protein TraF [Chlorobium sp.]